MRSVKEKGEGEELPRKFMAFDEKGEAFDSQNEKTKEKTNHLTSLSE